jgi:hypothetical protein
MRRVAGLTLGRWRTILKVVTGVALAIPKTGQAARFVPFYISVPSFDLRRTLGKP